MAKEPKTQRQKLLILAKKGDPDSQEQLGWAYETGNCGTQIISIDYIEAIKWYKEAAKNGKTFSLFRLGTIYENHNNLKVAYSYYSQAADQCHEKSIEKVMLFGEKYNIDISSINHNSKQESVNKIVERNDEQNKIILNLEIESLKGDINSQLKLGKIFFKYEDYKQAFKWYSMAANKGDRTAQWMIGTMFETGKGVIENLDESIVWYKKSAEQNDVNSQFRLGYIYELKIRGYNKNRKAVNWYIKAALQNDLKAMLRLSKIYYKGEYGVKRNINESYKWLNMAVDLGDLNAILYKEKIVNKNKIHISSMAINKDNKETVFPLRLGPPTEIDTFNYFDDNEEEDPLIDYHKSVKDRV